MEEEELVKKLAKLKAYLERRKEELEEELSNLKALTEIVNGYLAEKSFKRVEALKPAEEEGIPIRTVDGAHLGNLLVEGRTLTVTFDPSLKCDSNIPPLRAFLIAKVLEPMRKKDEEAVKAGRIEEKDAFSYTVEEEGGIVKRIIVKNFGDERRLTELKNAIRWTLRRIYERVVGGS